MAQMEFWRAINQALDECMAADERVVLFGEDVGLPGGIYGVTRQLAKKYGPTRIWDTPISEAAFVGIATGAAMTGLRPIIEIMYMDFTLVAMDQLVNHAAKMRFLSQGQYSVPLVVRSMNGIIPGSCAQHSQTFDAWFNSVPGFTVIAPSTHQDAYSLMKAAVALDDPVLFLEHRSMYFLQGEVDTAMTVPIGRGVVRRSGDDLTIVSWSKGMQWSLEAADLLREQKVNAEVIDLRTVSPVDYDLILKSVARTRRLLVVHEAIQQGGLGAEIAARVAQELPSTRIGRVGSAFAPIAPARSLAATYVPQVEGVVATALKLQ